LRRCAETHRYCPPSCVAFCRRARGSDNISWSVREASSLRFAQQLRPPPAGDPKASHTCRLPSTPACPRGANFESEFVVLTMHGYMLIQAAPKAKAKTTPASKAKAVPKAKATVCRLRGRLSLAGNVHLILRRFVRSKAKAAAKSAAAVKTPKGKSMPCLPRHFAA